MILRPRPLFFILMMCVVASSCSIFSSAEKGGLAAENPLAEFFPVQGGFRYTYRVHLDEEVIERVLEWKSRDKVKGATVYFFTDGKGFTKAYEITPEAVYLKGITLENQLKPNYYKGENPCLKMPLEVGNHWRVDARMDTKSATIQQEGWGRIVKIDQLRTEAGSFESIKVLFNITSEHQIKKTGEKAIITAQFTVWYGKGVGLLRQYGTALSVKENQVINLHQELIKYEKE